MSRCMNAYTARHGPHLNNDHADYNTMVRPTSGAVSEKENTFHRTK